MALRHAVCGAALLAVLPASIASAQAPADFYRGKTIELYIDYSVGGGYDLYARMIARHLGKHIPGNPMVVPKNMEGGGGMRLANWLYNVAPKDGTAIGAVAAPWRSSRCSATRALNTTAASSPSSAAPTTRSACASRGTPPASRHSRTRRTGNSWSATGGVADDTYQYPAILNNMFGTKFKMVTGLSRRQRHQSRDGARRGAGALRLPWSTVKATRRFWIDEKKINLLMQFSLGKHADLPDVPLVMDLAKTDEQRTILKLIFGRQVMGRPYVAPPGVPKERVAMPAQGLHGHHGGQGVSGRGREGEVRDHTGCRRKD